MKARYISVAAGWMLLVLAGSSAGQSTWHVDDNNCPGPGAGTKPDPFCSIQAGIDQSVNGDEVLVAVGTYNETINFDGKAIRLLSSNGPELTIIDATGLNDTVVRCVSGEGPDTVLQGFTITGGFAFEGGGMVNVNSSPTVTNCIFFGNVADAPNPAGCGNGGGMYNFSSSPTMTNCVFRHNKSKGWGGGGGVNNNFLSNPMFTNCTFVENDATNGLNAGGGMLNINDSNPIVSNCIFWGNVDRNGMGELAQIKGPAVVNYSIVQGGWTGAGGVGNIETDPLFIDPDGSDNIFGTLDDNLRLLPGSPAIDAGDNTAVPNDTTDLDGDGDTTEQTPLDLDGDARFVDDPLTLDTGNGTPPIVDMGAYEFQLCGNGVIDIGEECDDGGESTTCDDDCTIAECGDGTVNLAAGEECDDGNLDDGDLCSGQCLIEGACCDRLDGFCRNSLLQSECDGAQPVWTGGVRCGEILCDPSLGSCCNIRFGTCNDKMILSDCVGDHLSWTKAEFCSSENCPDPFIPTISEWGLVILTLLLLITAKIYFGRQHMYGQRNIHCG